MPNNIRTVELDGEKIYLKKSKIPLLGWKVVYPWKNEDGSWNYFNLLTGGWPNLITVVLLVALVLVFFLANKELINNLNAITSNPFKYCSNLWRINS